jgi:hypothetical protein
MFSFSSVITYPLTIEAKKKYKNEVELIENLIKNTVSLCAYHPIFSSKVKIARKALNFFKSLENAEKGICSIQFLANWEEIKKTDTSIIILNIASVILFPFTVIDLIEKVKPLDDVQAFFKHSPILSSQKYAAIPTFALITLMSTLVVRCIYKGKNLGIEQANMGLNNEYRKIKAIEITLNNYDMAEKAFKTASLVFSLSVSVLAVSNPAITGLKITFIAIDMICVIKKYQLKEEL